MSPVHRGVFAVGWKMTETIGAAEWYDSKLGKYKDQELARLVGTTPRRIKRRRELFGIPPYSINQAIEPYAHLIGVLSDRALSEKCGASVTSVRMYREKRGIEPRAHAPHRQQRLPSKHPLLPFQDALRLVPAEEVAVAANVPLQDVLDVCAMYGIKPPKAVSQATDSVADRYIHLFGLLPNAVIAKIAGIPVTRIAEIRKSKKHKI